MHSRLFPQQHSHEWYFAGSSVIWNSSNGRGEECGKNCSHLRVVNLKHHKSEYRDKLAEKQSILWSLLLVSCLFLLVSWSFPARFCSFPGRFMVVSGGFWSFLLVSCYIKYAWNFDSVFFTFFISFEFIPCDKVATFGHILKPRCSKCKL